jgi:hypothetical protein
VTAARDPDHPLVVLAACGHDLARRAIAGFVVGQDFVFEVPVLDAAVRDALTRRAAVPG